MPDIGERIATNNEIFEYKGHGVWEPVGVKSKVVNEDNESINVQNPFPTDGDSVYVKDIDFDNSDFTGWSGDPEKLFESPFSDSITNNSSDNPKYIIIAFNIAKILANHGLVVMCCFVSPIAHVRDQFKEQMGDKFKEIYVKCSEKTCAKRDVKGMWKKAKDGDIKNFTGYNDPYEIPKEPDLILNTEEESVNESCHKVLQLLED